jgi:nicotinic acid mononucleotide adenylyltransferase
VSREHDGATVDGATVDGHGGAPLQVRIPRLDVSSSDLRRRVAAGEPIDGLVPEAAVRVLRERHLYTRT